MKTSLLTILSLVFIALTGNAQITLTSSCTPVPGDIFYSQGCDTTGVLQGNSGANVQWNFSSLVPDGTPVVANYVDPATTSGSTFFPGTTVAHMIDSTMAMYYTVTSNAYVFNGISGSVFLEQFSDPQTMLEFPFTYNSTFTDPFEAVGSAFGFPSYHSGTSEVTADGYGSLVLPEATYQNVLRIKAIVSSMDSSNIFGQITLTYDYNESYNWYADGIREPIFQIVFSSNTSQGNTTYSKAVGYRTQNTSIPNAAVGEDVIIFPNPASDQTQLKINSATIQNAKINIYDLNGRIVRTVYNGSIHSGENYFKISTADLCSGVYELQLITNTQNHIYKLSVR